LLASLINPYGPGLLVYVASIGSNPVIRDYVTEWSPTTVSWHEGIMFFTSLAVLGALMLKSRLRLAVFEVLVLLAFGYLAWSSVRAIVWWGLVITPTLARLLGSSVPNRLGQPGATREKPVLNAAILVGIGCLAILVLPWFKTSISILPRDERGVFSPDTPVAVGEYLRTHEPPSSGMLLNDQTWGAFDYLDIVFPSARWRTLLDQYHIGYLVLSKADEADLVADVRADAGWRLDYEDDQAVVFSRADASASP